MAALDALFEKKQGALFMPYVCCGDPDLDFTVELVEALAKNGADAIELGIPFSDPVADGKALQAASCRALSSGMTPKKALGVVARLRKGKMALPIVIMAYYNTFYSQGIGRFLLAAKRAGADGVIVPDLPLEESGGFRKACTRAGLAFVPLVTPNCDSARIRKIAKGAGGFLYAVSVIGTTGARDSVSRQALRLVTRAKQASGMRVAAGFGISAPAHAREFAMRGADGVIVGSRIAEIYSAAIGRKNWRANALKKVAGYCRGMKRACAAPKCGKSAGL